MKIKAVLTVMLILITLGIAVIPQETVSRAHPSDVASPSFTPTKADHRGDESASAANASSPEDVTDRIIIRYRPTTAGLFSPAQDEQMQRLSRHAGTMLTYLREMSGDAHVIRLPQKLPAAQVERIAKRLADLPEVEYAEPDRIVRHTLTPNDPRYGEQWHYYERTGGINAPAAWDITTGSDAIVVAILDTGVTDHPDLTRNVPGLGYDFVLADLGNDGDGRDSDPRDPGDWCENVASSWHGTHVAGTIGADSNNGVGVAGVNWTSPLLHVRVLGACGEGSTSDIIDGLRWAAGLPVPGVPANAHPARVVNLSLGGKSRCSPAWQSAINDVTAQGVVVVVAAGNENQDAANFTPAGCDGVITVAATDRNGSKARFSNFGAAVEISAPGVNVLSTWNTGTTTPGAAAYTRKSGTSMAAPHVSGVVSLMLSRNPSLTPAQVLAILQRTARRFPPGSTCTTSLCGSGIVDAEAAVRAAGDAVPTPTSTPTATSASTPTPTPTPTSASTPTPTSASTPTPTSASTPTPTPISPPNSHKVSLPMILKPASSAPGTPAPTPTPTLPSTPTPTPPSASTPTSTLPSTPTPTLPSTPTPTPPSTPTPTPPSTPTLTPPSSGWQTLVSTTFENDFPGLWRVYDDDGSSNGEYFWAQRNCQSFEGSFSGWAVGGGGDGSALDCGADYPDSASASMEYGPFSLVGATGAELRFKLWMDTEQDFDMICAMASVDGSNWYGSCWSGDSGGWVDRRFDLSNVYQIGNLLGRSQVWITLWFSSDSSVTRAEGVYVDNLALRVCPAGVSCPATSSVPAEVDDTLTEFPFAMTRSR